MEREVLMSTAPPHKGTRLQTELILYETHLIHKKEDVPKDLPKDLLDFFKKQENLRKSWCESILKEDVESKGEKI